MIFNFPSAMPTHWESSERPLFVRTVVVNGSRHAILSHVDPLCPARKADSSPEGLEPSREGIPNPRRIRSCYPSKRDISSELQKCLVKLRVVLSTQEHGKRLKKDALDKDEISSREKWQQVRKSIVKSRRRERDEVMTKELKEEDITGFRRGNSYCSAVQKKESDDNSEDTDGSNKDVSPPTLEVKQSGNEIAKLPDRTNFIRRMLPLSEATEELLRNYSSYFFPIVYIKADNLKWEDVAGESAVPKSVHNPLSERVLQWLDLARRRKESLMDVEKSKTNTENQQKGHRNADDKTQHRKNKPVRCKSESSLNKSKRDEDVEDEVKQESDIETVLSSTSTHEYPKYSRKLNKLHIMRDESPHKQTEKVESPVEDHWEKIISIPERTNSDFSLTEQLQQSILESFEAIVNLERKAALDRRKAINSSRKKSHREVRNSSGRSSRKKSLLMKQTTIRISSDEEETPEMLLNRRRTRTAGKRNGYFSGKKSWKYLGQRVQSAKSEQFELSDESSREMRIIYSETPLSIAENHGGRRIWATEKGPNKPHLHIFMPGINTKMPEAQEESTSDTESIAK